MSVHVWLHEWNRFWGHETQLQQDDIFRYRKWEVAPPSHEKFQEASAKLVDEQVSTTIRAKVTADMLQDASELSHSEFLEPAMRVKRLVEWQLLPPQFRLAIRIASPKY
ncbi:hypothetical protein [Rhizobium sp. LEGMi135b]